MAQDLSTIGSIATFLNNVFPGLPTSVSNNLVIIVDSARQTVENYVGVTIGSNSIANVYQPSILNFAKADTVDLFNAQAGGEKIRLAELSLEETGEEISAKEYRLLAEMTLKSLPRDIKFEQSLS